MMKLIPSRTAKVILGRRLESTFQSTFLKQLHESVASLPLREAVLYNGPNYKWSAKDFMHFVDGHSNALLETKFEKGQWIGIWLTDSAEKHVIMTAAARIGLGVVDIHPTIDTVPEVRKALGVKEIRALYFITSDDTKDSLLLLRKSIPEFYHYDDSQGQWFHSKYYQRLKFFIQMGFKLEIGCLNFKSFQNPKPMEVMIPAVLPTVTDTDPFYTTVTKGENGNIVIGPTLTRAEILDHPNCFVTVSNKSMTCGIQIASPQTLLSFGGALSLFSHCIIFILYYYFQIPNLRRHPTTLTIHKCWFEVLFVSQFLWMFSVDNSFFWLYASDDDSIASQCIVNPIVWPLSWITQFSLLGGELWFAVLSLDIHIALTNPFSSYKVNAMMYTINVYLLSILSATLLVAVVPIQYGLSTDPMIWVADDVDFTINTVNMTKVFMFYMWMAFIYGYCGCIAVWAQYQIQTRLSKTLQKRQYSVNKQSIYVGGYFLFWTCVFVFQLMNYVNRDVVSFLAPQGEKDFRSISAFLLASRGLWSLSFFLLANWFEISEFFSYTKPDKKVSTLQIDEKPFTSVLPFRSSSSSIQPPQVEEERVQLNIALQEEIVHFTGLGIQQAAKEMLTRKEQLEKQSVRSSSFSRSFFSARMPGDSFFIVIPNETFNNSFNADGAPTSDTLVRDSRSTNHTRYVEPEVRDTSIQSIPSNLIISNPSQLAIQQARKSSNPIRPSRYNFSQHYDEERLSTQNPLAAAEALADGVMMTENRLSAPEDNGTISSANQEEVRLQIDDDVRTESKDTNTSADASQRPMPSLDNDADAQFNLNDDSVNWEEHPSFKSTASVSARLGTSNNLLHTPTQAAIRSSVNNFVDQLLRGTFISKSSKTQKKNFQFTDYSPKRFAHIRELCGITHEEYFNSFNSSTLPSFSEGKSGAFMYFSADKKFIVKTTTLSEFQKLLTILPAYEKYLHDEHERHHQPLITRFVGAHRIIMYNIPMYVVIMQNVCPKRVDEKYDLKGSWVNRHGSRKTDIKNRRPKKIITSSTTPTASPPPSEGMNGFALIRNLTPTSNNTTNKKMKMRVPLFLDNDLQTSISLEPSVAMALAQQIQRDVDFLGGFNLMDYSLLIGVKRHNFLVLDENKKPYAGSQRTSRVSNSFDSESKASSNPNLSVDQNQIFVNRSNQQEDNKNRIVHLSDLDNPFHRDHDGAIHAAVVEGQGTFYIGLIDILQEWNWGKWMERMAKVYFLRKDPKGLSAIDSKSYRKRFLQRVIIDVFEFVDESVINIDDVGSNNHHTSVKLGEETIDSKQSGKTLVPFASLSSTTNQHLTETNGMDRRGSRLSDDVRLSSHTQSFCVPFRPSSYRGDVQVAKEEEDDELSEEDNAEIYTMPPTPVMKNNESEHLM